MGTREMKNKGLHPYRLRVNAEEKSFALAWDAMNQENATELLAWLLGDGTRRVVIEDRERVVAATVIQWLGSPVGQSFLQRLGYVRLEDWIVTPEATELIERLGFVREGPAPKALKKPTKRTAKK